MVFWIKNSKFGQWTWRLRSTKAAKFIAQCMGSARSEAECMEQINLIKHGSREATVIVEPPGYDTEPTT